MDIFFSLMQAGAFLVTVIIALVEYVKRFGVAGAWLNIASMVIGIALGAPFAYYTVLPKTGIEWFIVGVYGLVCGLIASGLYDAGKSLAAK